MLDALKAAVMGVVEGLTEFLPISSTGHLITTSALLNFETSLGETFEIFIQLGAVIAVIAFFSTEFTRQVRTVQHDSSVQRLWLGIVIAALPAALVGFLLRDVIKATLFTPWVVGITLIIGGVIFLLIEQRQQPREVTTPTVDSVTLRQAAIVGVVQTFALVPGVSRSGASIIGGLLCGMSRTAATAFSFYLTIPVLGGAAVLDLLLSLDEVNIQPNDLLLLALATTISGVVAWLSVRWLLKFVAQHSFVVFGWYRIAAGVVILLLVMFQVLPSSLS